MSPAEAAIARKMYDGTTPPAMPVLCRQCSKFQLVGNSQEVGTCPGEVWRKTWSPGAGYGMTPMVSGLARVCGDFEMKPEPRA